MPLASKPYKPTGVIISNGFKNFHLSAAAVEAERYGRLTRFISGAYPTFRVRSLAERLRVSGWQRYGKFLERGVPIDDRMIAALVDADALSEIAAVVSGRVSGLLGSKLEELAMRLFAHRAAREIARVGRAAGIYHYRAGYGLGSVSRAKAMGLVALCDHSIAHPRVLSWLVSSGGELPQPDALIEPQGFWRLVQRDIDAADHVLVNSRFVKQTFAAAGADSDSVSVVYLGVDEPFLAQIPPRRQRSPGAPLRMFFAGSFSSRKGADILAQAVALLPPVGWRLKLAGPVEAGQQDLLQELSARPNVRHLGNLTRRELAEQMALADLFVFPSLAEGSARVVFEALAAGCAVVTTPNAGSVVEDGAHGRLVRPGDVAGLAAALSEFIKHPEVALPIGEANKALVQSRFTQEKYGIALRELYDELLGDNLRIVRSPA